MRSSHSSISSVGELSNKCRICLKYHNDMIDIIASGISNLLMEVVNIEINSDDKLPKNMCQFCSKQLKEFHKFQKLAKDSDDYLRAYIQEQELELDNEAFSQEQETTQKRKKKLKRKYNKKAANCGENDSEDVKKNIRDDKMYLILVGGSSTVSGLQNEICIKDLDVEHDNDELINVCRSLVNGKSNDHTYPADVAKDMFFCSSNKEDTDVISEKNNKSSYEVNLFIYKCKICDESFDSEGMLVEHMMASHKSEPLNILFNFVCPVCSVIENDKNLFMEHLKEHKKEGCLFYKVDGYGRSVPLAKFEEEVFTVCNINENANVKSRVFKIVTGCYECFLCKKVESDDSIAGHLKKCFPDFTEECYNTPHMKLICPVCNDSWIDDSESYNFHLLAHKKDDVFFVKVDICGNPVDIVEDEKLFTPFEKVLQVLKFEGEEFLNPEKRIRIVKMQGLENCSICNFEANSEKSLKEHYLQYHEGSAPMLCITCPVCKQEFKCMNENERMELLMHLRDHKKEGVYFLKISNDGSINNSEDNSNLFSVVSDFFYGKIPCTELKYINNVSVPQVFLADNVNGEDSCDTVHENLIKKKDIVSQLKLHIKEMSKSGRDYICEKCGRKCFGMGNYRRHFLTHMEKSASSPKRPKCSVCDKTFSNRAILNKHIKYHSIEDIDGERPNDDSTRTICEICGKKLSTNASLAKHKRLHVLNKESDLLKCRFCERGFRMESALNRHVAAHLNPNYFECEICKLPLPTTVSLERHKEIHQRSSNTYDCKVCKVSFLSQDRLIAHQTHTGHHPDMKRFECNVCQERFFIGREFSKHIKLHPKYKMSECTLCGKRLSTMQSLMLHLGRHFESNSILCPYCGKQCFEEQNYHRHLLTHKGVKPFPCDVEGCTKSFYTYFELNRHKKYHNNTRDFSCPHCTKSFHESSHLKVHIRTHTGERPYTCPHCRKSFVTRTRCKQHINVVHQGVGCDLIQSNISKKVAVFQALETVS